MYYNPAEKKVKKFWDETSAARYSQYVTHMRKKCIWWGAALEIYNVSDAHHLPIAMYGPSRMAAKWGER